MALWMSGIGAYYEPINRAITAFISSVVGPDGMVVWLILQELIH